MPSRLLQLHLPRIARILLALSLLLALITPASASQTAPLPSSVSSGLPIELHSRRFVPTPGLDPALLQLANSIQSAGPLQQAAAHKRHIFVQFHHIPTPQQRDTLAQDGLTLLNYIPHNTWYASVHVDAVASLVRSPLIRWMGVVLPDDRLSANLSSSQLSLDADGETALQVQFAADVSLAQGQGIVKNLGGSVVGDVPTINTLLIFLPANRLAELSQHDEVLWVEPPLPQFEPMNDGIRQRIGVDTLQASPYSLNGTGVKILIYDTGTVNNTHPAFQGRITLGDSSMTQTHSTHVAGTAAGSGEGSPPGRDLRGMAPAATILSYGFQGTGNSSDWLYSNPGDLEQDWQVANADVGNASIGTNVATRGLPCNQEGDYGSVSQLIDEIVRGRFGSPYIAVWAAGNERSSGRCGTSYGTTPPPSNAKNPIHVGATNSDTDTIARFSSFGPSDDGRLKPTITAPGCEETGEMFIYSTGLGDSYTSNCGTSMAAPAVTGLAALMVQRYRQLYNPTGKPLPATVKAILIHTATDLGNPGPDYQSGYGRVNGVQAIDALANDFHEDVFNLTGETHSYTLAVASGQPSLKVSMAWDDFPATPSALVQLVNDLDLALVSPSGQIYRPWLLDPLNPASNATTGEDHLNNQEQVIVTNPEPGNWTVRVAAGVLPSGPQSYGIVFDGSRVAPLVKQFPNGCYTLTIGSVPESGGSVTVSPAPDCNNATGYSAGTTVTVTANPAVGYAFSGWGGDLTGQTNPLTIVMAADRTITGNFALVCYTLALSASNGAIQANPAPDCNNGTQYTPGTQVTLTALPDPGYLFQGWSGDLSGQNNPEILRMASNRAVTASFTVLLPYYFPLVGK